MTVTFKIQKETASPRAHDNTTAKQWGYKCFGYVLVMQQSSCLYELIMIFYITYKKINSGACESNLKTAIEIVIIIRCTIYASYMTTHAT